MKKPLRVVCSERLLNLIDMPLMLLIMSFLCCVYLIFDWIVSFVMSICWPQIGLGLVMRDRKSVCNESVRG